MELNKCLESPLARTSLKTPVACLVRVPILDMDLSEVTEASKSEMTLNGAVSAAGRVWIGFDWGETRLCARGDFCVRVRSCVMHSLTYSLTYTTLHSHTTVTTHYSHLLTDPS